MEKDIFIILKAYLKYWYLYLIGAIICLALAFLHIRYKITPEYYVSGKILLNSKEEGSGLGSFNNVGLIKNSSNIEDDIGVLRSYDLMQQTINELGLSVSYYVKGRFSEIEVYEKTLPIKIVLNDSVPFMQYGTLGTITIVDEFSYSIETITDDENIEKSTYSFGEKVNTIFGDFHVELTTKDLNQKIKDRIIVRFRSVSSLASNYSNRLDIYSLSGGGLLELSLTDAIPQRGVDIINKHIEVYAKNSADNKNFLAKSTLKLIDERLELLTTDLNIAEKDVETYKKNNDFTDIGSDATRFVSMADEVDRELADLRTELNVLNSLEYSLNQSSDQSFTTLNAYNIQNSLLSGYINAYNTEVINRRNLINASGTGNPLLPQIENKLLESRNFIIQNVKNSKVQVLRTQSELRNKLAQYRSKVSSVPSAERALLEINRDQGIKQSLYLYLLQKREEEALSISVPFSDIRIIETPKATSYPVNGSKMPIYLGAILFGIFIPFALVFTKNYLNTNILSKEDIEEITDNSILGKIANNNSKETIVVSGNNNSAVAELFRLMRHNLKFLIQGKNKQVIMVTSGKQGEGKTFVSINLAASLAITGKKVIVLGFDLRVPKLMKDMKLSYNQGLSDFIVDTKINLEDLIVSYPGEKNLFFIGSGPIPPNPGELILNNRVGELINELKQKFDYLVIDTPPIGKVADAYSLAPFVDSTLFVVRYNFTKKEELNVINEVNKSKNLNPLMIVFNDVKLDKTGIYSYGYKKNN